MKIGDRILLTKSKDKNKKKYEGLLMPKTEVGDPNALVIKLDTATMLA
ncbi:MAG: hypothetical protein ABIB79_04990 [archaeon]